MSAPDQRAGTDGDRRWPRRAPWLRFVLFAGFAASLPLSWTEEIHSGCTAGAPGAPVVRSGWTLVSREPQGLALIGTLLLSALLLALLARDVRAGVRVAAHVAASLASGLACFLLFFAATFTLFDRIRVLPGAWLGLGCLALATLEALVRALGELMQLLRERKARGRDARPPPD